MARDHQCASPIPPLSTSEQRSESKTDYYASAFAERSKNQFDENREYKPARSAAPLPSHYDDLRYSHRLPLHQSYYSPTHTVQASIEPNYTSMSNVATASIQLQREKHRCEGLEEDLRDMKDKFRSHSDKYRSEKHRWAYHTQQQSMEISDLHARITKLELEKNSVMKERDSISRQYSEMRKTFESQLKKCESQLA